MSAHQVLVLSALVFTLASALGKAPLWVAVFLLVLVHLLAAGFLRWS